MSSLWPAEMLGSTQQNHDEMFSWFPANNDPVYQYPATNTSDDYEEDISELNPRPHSSQNKRDFSTIYEESAEYRSASMAQDRPHDATQSLGAIPENNSNQTGSLHPTGNHTPSHNTPMESGIASDADVYPVLRMKFTTGKPVRVPSHLRPHSPSRDLYSGGQDVVQGSGHGLTRTQKLDWFPEGKVMHNGSVRQESDGSNSHLSRQEQKQSQQRREVDSYQERYIRPGHPQHDHVASPVQNGNYQYGYGYGTQYGGGEQGKYQYKTLPKAMNLPARLESVRGVYTNTMTIQPYNGRAGSPRKHSPDRDREVRYDEDLSLPMVSSASRSQLMAAPYMPAPSNKSSVLYQEPMQYVPPQHHYADRWNQSLQEIEQVYTPATQYSLNGPVKSRSGSAREQTQSRNSSAHGRNQGDRGMSGRRPPPSHLPPLQQQRQQQQQQQSKKKKQVTIQSAPSREGDEDDLDSVIMALEAKCGLFDDIIEREKELKRKSKSK